MVHVMKFQSFEAEEHATEALEHIPKCHASVWKAKKKSTRQTAKCQEDSTGKHSKET